MKIAIAEAIAQIQAMPPDAVVKSVTGEHSPDDGTFQTIGLDESLSTYRVTIVVDVPVATKGVLLG